jgi:hypothetical protein
LTPPGLGAPLARFGSARAGKKRRACETLLRDARNRPGVISQMVNQAHAGPTPGGTPPWLPHQRAEWLGQVNERTASCRCELALQNRLDATGCPYPAIATIKNQ